MLNRLRRALGLPLTLPEPLGVLDAYARWAPAYPPEAHNPFMRLEESALLALLPDVAGKWALDLACGTGRYARILRARGAARVLGLDLSPQMLAGARGLGAALVRGDLSATPFRPSVFDVVTCGLALGHVRDLGAALAEVSRLLEPGGVVVYSDFHPFAHAGGARRTFHAGGREHVVEHHVHYYADHVAACRAAGLDIEEVREPQAATDPPFPAVLAVRARKLQRRS